MSKHIPGPWISDGDDGGPYWSVWTDTLIASRVATLTTDGDPAVIQATARLIAAAPDMLKERDEAKANISALDEHWLRKFADETAARDKAERERDEARAEIKEAAELLILVYEAAKKKCVVDTAVVDIGIGCWLERNAPEVLPEAKP